jgi:hypothetical protein
VVTPDGLRIEILEDKNQPCPSATSTFTSTCRQRRSPRRRAWYAKIFGAAPGTRNNNPVADIPGVQMRFAKTDAPTVTTKGPRARSLRVRRDGH